jgi:hypothetical protein
MTTAAAKIQSEYMARGEAVVFMQRFHSTKLAEATALYPANG